MVPVARKWIASLDIGDVDEVIPAKQVLKNARSIYQQWGGL
jgi:hypothetical protein